MKHQDKPLTQIQQRTDGGYTFRFRSRRQRDSTKLFTFPAKGGIAKK